MSRRMYCPICHGSLVKADVNGLIDELYVPKDGEMVFDLLKVKETEKSNPEKIKKIRCYNCKRQLKYFVK